MDILLWITAVLLILIGMTGVILPAVPGVPLVFFGMLIGAWIDGFQKVSGWTIAVLGFLTVLSLAADIGAGMMGAKRVNASRQALWGAFLGSILGLFGGLPGLIMGPFIGAAIGEFIAGRDLVRAGQVGWATWVGMALAVAAKLALCFAMIGIFITSYFWKNASGN